MATRSEFAASIKAKYPQYQGVDDSTLVDRMLEKYPQYRDRVTDDPPAERPSSMPGREAQGAFGEAPDQEQKSAMFPNAVQVEGRGLGPAAARVGLMAVDAMGYPQRKAAEARGMDAADPESHFLKPETDAAVAKAEADLKAHPEARNIVPPGGVMGMPMMMPTADMVPALTEVGGRMADDPMLYLGPLVSALRQSPKLFEWLGKATGLVNKGAGRLAEEMSGVSEEALRMAGTKRGREALQASAGKERELGEELLSNIENADDFIPEKQVVSEALEKMGPIDLGSAVRSLEGSKGASVAGRLSPEKGAANSGIQKYVDFLRGGPMPEDLVQGAREARRASGAADVESAALGAQAGKDGKEAAQAVRAQASAQSKAAKAAGQAGKTKKEFLDAADKADKNLLRWGGERNAAGQAAESALEQARESARIAREAATDARAKVAVGEISKAEAAAAQKAAEAAERGADVAEAAARLKSGDNLKVVARDLSARGMPMEGVRDILQQAKSKVDNLPELPDQTVSAREYRDLRRDLDVPVNWEQEGAGIKNNALKAGRTTMKNELLRKAEESGNPKYAEAMRAWSDKLDKLERIKDLLGKTGSTRDRRVEQFINNLFGKNSEHKQRLMRDLDEIFGSNITERARASQLASQLGPEGSAGWLPRQFTGRSALGFAAGAGLGAATNPAAGLSTVLLASPKIASHLTLPAITKLEQGLKASGIALTPKANKLMSALKRPADDAQKARLAGLLAAELEASMPANAIPFRMKPAAEREDESTPRYTRQ